MRPLASALAACGGSSGPSGNPEGAACVEAKECRSGLVCFQQACASAIPPSASCAVPGGPRIVLGDAVAATEPAPGACVEPVRDPVLAPGELQDLGELQVGASARFEIPGGTFSGARIANTVVRAAVTRARRAAGRRRALRGRRGFGGLDRGDRRG